MPLNFLDQKLHKRESIVILFLFEEHDEKKKQQKNPTSLEEKIYIIQTKRLGCF